MLIKKIVYIIFVAIFATACVSKKYTTKNIDNKSKQTISVTLQEEFDKKFYAANKEKLIDNYEQAANLFSQCLQINNNSAVCNYELGRIYYKQNRLTECNLFAKKAYDLEPKNNWYAQLYANLLMKQKQLDQAVFVLSALTKNNPNERNYYYDEASVYIYQEKYNNAIETYNRAEKIFGIDEDLINRKKQIYLKQNKLNEAVAEVKKIADLYPNSPNYNLSIADMYLSNKKPDDAYKYLQKAVKISPSDPYVNLSLSEYYRSKGRFADSYESLKAAFKSPELDATPKSNVLLSYYNITNIDTTTVDNTKNKAQAYELTKILQEVHPTDARAYFIAADFLLRDKKTTEAIDNYEKGVSFDKENFPAWNQLILLCSDLQNYDKMLLYTEEAISLFPNQAALYLYRGVAFLQKKNYKDAIPVLKQGASVTVDNNELLSNFYTYLGDSYHAEKDYKSSDENYEKALKINPNNIYVLNNYAYYLSERGEELEKAASMSKKTIDAEPTVNNYLDTYAWILFKQKKYTEAIAYQIKAIEGDTPSAVMFEHLGDMYSVSGNVEKALENWNKALGKLGASNLLDKKIKEKKYVQ